MPDGKSPPFPPEAGLLCAGACWAGVVMPPANGLWKLVELLVFFLGVLLLVAPVETEPTVIVVGGAIALRFLAGEGGERRRSAQHDGAGAGGDQK